VTQSQPSSSTPPVPSTSSPQVQPTPPPIPTPTPPPIPTPTPPPIPTPTPPPIPTPTPPPIPTPTPPPIPTPTPPPIPTPTPPPIPTPTPPPIPTPTPPPIPTTSPTPIPISTPTPTPIPDTEPTPFEHIYEEPSPVHQPSSPPQEQAQGQMAMDDLLQVVPKLISRIDSLETDLKQTNQDDPLASSVQGLVTPSTTKVKASGEEQVEDISPNTLEAAKTLSKVASLKPRSIDKGRRYKRRKEAKGKKVVSSLDFQEEVDTGAEQVNTPEGINIGSIKLSTVSEQLNTGSKQVSTVSAKQSTSSHDKGQREGKAPMIGEETPKKSKKKSTRGQSPCEAMRWDSLQKKKRYGMVEEDEIEKSGNGFLLTMDMHLSGGKDDLLQSDWLTEEATPMSHELPLRSVHSLRHDEGSLSLTELMVLCTSLSKKVEGLESKLKTTKQTYSAALTKLIKRVKRFEQTIKTSKARRRTKIAVSEDEDALEDSSKQGRKISAIDKDPTISLVHPKHEMEHGVSTAEETSWFQENADIQIRTSKLEVSTAQVQISTASATPEDSTAAENLVYVRRSADKRKDKGKGIMTEPEPEKKTKLQQRQERASLEAAIRLEEQFNEEESKRIARDAEIARQLQEEINKAEQEKQEVVTKDDPTHEIDWSDPAMIRYFKGMSYEDIRPIFEKVWDQIHSFVPMDSEVEVHRLKRKGQEVQEEPVKRQRTRKVSESVQEQTDEEPKLDELT
ncbi:hypothetical protein Tco_0709842, partial [Tanacetum coccineum]